MSLTKEELEIMDDYDLIDLMVAGRYDTTAEKIFQEKTKIYEFLLDFTTLPEDLCYLIADFGKFKKWKTDMNKLTDNVQEIINRCLKLKKPYKQINK